MMMQKSYRLKNDSMMDIYIMQTKAVGSLRNTLKYDRRTADLIPDKGHIIAFFATASG
jgi:hypothetical protein